VTPGRLDRRARRAYHWRMTTNAAAPDKPATLQRPLRRFVKRWGKRVTRALARYQARQSLVPDAPFLDPGLFPFLALFETRWREIEAEARAILRHREAIPAFQEISPDQYRIATAKNWRTFVLFGFGERLDRNCAQAPVTAAMLEEIPTLQTAWFSILAPGYHIPAHSGVTKGIVRAHLGLIVPREREKCRIRVGDEIRAWTEGSVIVLDDTYNHEVWNDTDEERVILLFDFDRPMRLGGRIANRMFLRAMKLSAFYREPRAALADFEARFEAATRRADQTLEKLGER